MREPAKAYRILVCNQVMATAITVYIGCESEAHKFARWSVEVADYDVTLVSTDPVDYVQRTTEEAQAAQELVHQYALWDDQGPSGGSGTGSNSFH